MSAGFKVVSFCWNKSEKICVPLIELYSIIVYDFWGEKMNISLFYCYLAVMTSNI